MSFALNLFLFVWTLSISAYLILIKLDVIKFDSVDALLYLLMCVGLFIYGIVFKLRNFKHLKYTKSITCTANRAVVNLLCITACLGGILLFINAGGYVGDLEKQRELHITGTTFKVSFLSYLGQFGISGGIIGISLLPWTKQSRFSKIIFLLTALIGFLLLSLFTGGRISLFVFLITLVLSFTVKYYKVIIKHKIKMIFFGLIVFLALGALMTSWGFIRETSSLEYVFTQTRAISKILHNMGLSRSSQLNQILSIVIYRTFGYVGDGIYHFEPFYKVYKPHPLFGGYQFNFISSRFPGADWFSWKNEVEDCYRHFGMFWNVWGTFVREFVVDFGWWCAPILCFVMGYIIAVLEINAMKSPALLSLYILSLCWICMSSLYSLLVYRYFHIAVLMIAYWLLLSLNLPRKRVN